MAGKPGFSFGFAKKAEPKRHVEALSIKEKEKREEIRGVEEGKLELEDPKEGEGPPVIKCKNPLDGRKAPKKLVPDGEKTKSLPKSLEEMPGGLVTKNMSKLSDEDAEAMRELLNDAARQNDGEDVPTAAPMPILMKPGSKQVRESGGADTSKDMFEKQPVETFGEAMLRGMGYDPKVHVTKPVVRDKLRDNLLGLGAKALLPGEKAQIAAKKNKTPVATTKVSRATASAVAASGDADEDAPDDAKDAPDPEAASKTGQQTPAPEPPEKRRRVQDDESKPEDNSKDIWTSRGLVVKIVSKEANIKDFYGAEAVVLEVDESKQTCRIKARPAKGGKSQVLQGIKLEELETRVSRDCDKVRIVRGPQKGMVAKLVKRDTARGVAVLRINGAESDMPLDDVCQFME